MEETQARIPIDQEDSNRILAIGHKVLMDGNQYIISDIRIWHDLGSMLPTKHFYPVCDLSGIRSGRRVIVNARFEDLEVWQEPQYKPARFVSTIASKE